MKKETKRKVGFAVLAVAFPSLVMGVLATSGVEGFQLGSLANGDGEWVHYAMRAATSTQRGVREYWIQCDGDYQFTAPQGVQVREGTQYNTSEFAQNDPRWVDWTDATVFYDLTAKAFDFVEAGDYSAYSVAGKAASQTFGTKEYISFSKNDTEPSVQFEVLTVSQVIKTLDQWNAMLKANGAAQTASTGFTGYYVLGADIDCGGINYNVYAADENAANIFPQMGFIWGHSGFDATFDGRGHAVRNFGTAWLSGKKLGIFGDVTEGGLIKNTLFEVPLWNGYGAILADCVTGAFRNNMVVVKKMRDNAANSPMCYDARQSGNQSFYQNITKVDAIEGVQASNKAYLILRDGRGDAIGSYTNNVAVATVTNEMFNATKASDYNAKNAKVANMTALIAQGDVAGYEFIKTAITVKDGAYYFGKAKICDLETTALDMKTYVEAGATGGTEIDISAFASKEVLAVKVGSTSLDFSVEGNTLTIAGGQFGAMALGENAITYVTKACAYSAKLYVCSDVITTKEELAAMLKANGAKQTADDKGFTGYYVLGADIDCENVTFGKYDASADKPYNVIPQADRKWGGGFAATFDGCGFAIRNFKCPYDSMKFGLFGDASGGGVIMNTLFDLGTNEWSGYGAILCDAVYNTVIKNNMIVFPSMKDNAANSAIAYDAVGTSKCIYENVVYYKGTTNLTNSKLILRDGRTDAKGGYMNNVGVTSTTTGLFNSSAAATHEANNAKVADLAALAAQGSVTGYSFLNTLLSKKGDNYYWGNALIA